MSSKDKRPKDEPAPKSKRSGDESPKLRWRTFDGPSCADEPMRVTFTRQAYADLVAHAKAELESEIAGVLVGEFCEDEEGTFVAVDAALRGDATRRGGAHVTYTQETWNRIHETLEKDHPGRSIVGWYHSHPGFGVTLSDNDLFIQKNFFSGPGQVGFVIDPLGGEETICVNAGEGVEYVSRFWVEGRERRCRREAAATAKNDAAAPGDADLRESVRTLETRLSQVIRSVEESRTLTYRTIFTLGFFVALVVVAFVFYQVWESYSARANPPKLASFSYMPMPLEIDGHVYRVGVNVVGWEIPKDMLQEYNKQVIIQWETEKAKMLEEAQKKMNAPAGATPPPLVPPSPPPADNATRK